MTVLAQATPVGPAGAAVPFVPVDIAARIIAAGIAPQLDARGKPVLSNGKPVQLARITLALTPVTAKPTDYGAIDLVNWPTAVGALLAPGSTVQVQVVPIDADGGRVAPTAGNPSGIKTTPKAVLPLNVRPHPVSDGDLSTYWQNVMGSGGEIQNLATALGTGRQALRQVLRDTTAGSTPDIHGAGRSAATVELSLERARQILGRLSGSSTDTRPPAEDGMTRRVRDIFVPLIAATTPEQVDAALASLSDRGKAAAKQALQNIDAAVARLLAQGATQAEANLQRSDWVALAVRNVLEDEDAWKALETSRTRADATAKARLDYQNAATAEAAIAALTGSDCHIGRRAPFQIAADWQRDNPPGPKLEEPHASHRLASQTAGPEGTEVKPADDGPDPESREFARRRFFALQANPSLARLFRFVVDLECPIEVLDQVMAAAQPHPEAKAFDHDAIGRVAVPTPNAAPARYLLLSAQIQQLGGAPPRLQEIWSAAKLRWHAGGLEGHFYPCTREEIDAAAANKDLRELAIAEQIDGMIDLGQAAKCDSAVEPRFDILTLDAITSTAADIHFEQTRAQSATILQRAEAADEPLPPEIIAEITDKRRATLRTGGLALADRWRQNHAIARHRAAMRQYETNANDPILLDASDLSVGYKLDVGVKSRAHGPQARRHWHTLMRRNVVFKDEDKAWPGSRPLDAIISGLYADRLSRLRADDGVLTVPAALRELDSSKATAFAEEIVGAWRGDPLGLAAGEEKHRLDSRDLRVGMTLDLPKRTDSPNAEDFTPPPLRFGWRYHFGMRAVFAGGVSMPLERALNHYEFSHDGALVLPAAKQAGRAFRRHERIDTPRIAIPEWAFGQIASKPGTSKKTVQLRNHFGSEQALRMVVRSVGDPENRKMLGLPPNAAEDTGTSGVSISRRVLMVPPVTLDFAGLHDAFRTAATDKNLTLFEPRVLRDKDPEDPRDRDEDPAPGEGVRVELVPAPAVGKQGEFWKAVRVAWRAVHVVDRPRGGLLGIDHHAAWGGFPIFQMAPVTGQNVKPERGKPVLRSEGTVTDEGEILDRLQGLDPVTFPAAPSASGAANYLQPAPRKVPMDWNAVAGNPAGSAVFRPLDASRKNEKERLPYYPDPATASLVIEVRVKGASKERPIRIGTCVAKVYGSEPSGAVPAGYPDAMPVVLDVVRGNLDSGPLIGFGTGGESGTAHYASLAFTPKHALSGARGTPSPPIPVRHVVVRLAPGEEATIRAWCLPSLSFLNHMFEGTEAIAALSVACGCASAAALGSQQAVDDACVAGIKALCKGVNLPTVKTGAPSGPAVGGLPTPTQPLIEAIGKLIHTFMAHTPLPEIAAPIEIDAVHVVDLPLAEPSFDPPQQPLPLLRLDDALLNALLETYPDPAHKSNPPPLYDPETWKLSAQVPNAMGVLLAGTVKLHGPSTGAIEIYASGAAAARGRFDDPERGRSRDDRARGLWPKPDGVRDMDPADLFGFKPSASGRVTLKSENVTLLRIEGFTPDSARLDLLEMQRAAFRSEKAHRLGQSVTEEESSLRAQRPSAFPDNRARHINLFAAAISRNTGLLRTRYDEFPEHLAKPTAKLIRAIKPEEQPTRVARQWLPATVRPGRVVPQSMIPSFRWTYETTTNKKPGARKLVLTTCRKMSVRVRMRRPWFSSGEGERIGIVLWPPHLFTLESEDIQQDVIRALADGRDAVSLRSLPSDGSSISELQDIDLGPGGAWVTRWGADPIRPGYPVHGALLSPANFGDPATAKKRWDTPPPENHRGLWTAGEKVWDAPPERRLPDRAIIPNALMPVPATADSPEARDAEAAGGFMTVALLTHEARFDPEQELWYADVDIDPLDVSYPFVRVGLVRYQPHAPRKLRTSEPITEWIQLLPERRASASFEESSHFSVLTVTVKGPASKRGDSEKTPEVSSAQRPLMRISLLRRVPGEDGTASAETVFASVEAHSEMVSGGLEWTESFSIGPEYLMEDGVIWSLFAEEVERMRPATYPDEPRYGTTKDTLFAETGPRFATKFELNELWDWMKQMRKERKP